MLHAPVVQWIECELAELVMQVQFLPGAKIFTGGDLKQRFDFYPAVSVI